MSRMPEDMTQELLVLALIVVVLGVLTYPFFNFESAELDRSSASQSLSNWVDEDIDPLCRGTGSGDTTVSVQQEFDGTIDEIEIESGEDVFNASLRGDAGYVKKGWQDCDTVKICQPGSDGDGCPDGGYIPVSEEDFNPSFTIFYNTNDKRVVIDPDT